MARLRGMYSIGTGNSLRANTIERSMSEHREFGPKTIIVDGYNAIHRTDGLHAAAARSLAAGRDALLRLLDQRYRHTPHRVIVVFDGDQHTETIAYYHRIRTIFAAHHEPADRVIVRLVAAAQAAGEHVIVVSDDLEVQDSTNAAGGQSASARQLADHLYAAPKDVARRARHRQFVRSKLGLDRERDDKDTHPDRPAKRPHRSRPHHRSPTNLL
jgi:predicted RNA-binding protein with PIN domain